MLILPNILTLSRILAVPILLFLLWPGVIEGSQQPMPIDYALAFGLYCLMGITDYFDCYVARSRGIVSRLGAFLDPIADKIMIAAVILLLVFTRDITGYHVIAALMILLREIIVSGLREFLARSEEKTSELQSLMRISYAVLRLKKTKTVTNIISTK